MLGLAKLLTPLADDTHAAAAVAQCILDHDLAAPIEAVARYFLLEVEDVPAALRPPAARRADARDRAGRPPR